jgi:hypothetical protein
LPDDVVAAQEPIAPVDALAECLDCVLPELSADDRAIVCRCDLEGMKQVKALVTDKLPSMGRSSEYPSDDVIGICIKTAAVAEQNSLRLP